MGNTAKKDIIRIRALKRDQDALRLRERGWSYAQIAAELKYGGEANARRAIKRRTDAQRGATMEAAEDVRHFELLRLDRMLKVALEKAEAGDLQAIDRVLRIQERRTAYLGLDTPKSLHIELARNVETMLERIKAVVGEEEFERVLAAVGGIDRTPEAGSDPSGAAGEGAGDDGQEPAGS